MLKYDCITSEKLRCFDAEISDNTHLGVLGQRDSGKEDLIYLTLRLKNKKSGSIILDGVDIFSLSEEEMNTIRWAKISAVFYDPYSMFNPIYNVASHFAEIAISHNFGDFHFSEEIAKEYLKILGAKEELVYKHPLQLSPLEAKKISIALASFMEPKYIIVDDIEFGLNDNGRATIINSLIDLMQIVKSSFIILDNDPAVISRLADYVIVIYKGEKVEEGTDVLYDHYHPYTTDLISGNIKERNIIGNGCIYSENCAFSSYKCNNNKPEEVKVGNNKVKCFLYPWGT